MNKLLQQIAKFGLVGVIAFFVDFFIYTALNGVFRSVGFDQIFSDYYLVSQFISFVVSCVTNYLLSMKYVFERREDMSRQKEFVIFFLLSAIGLVINEITLYVGIGVLYENVVWVQNFITWLQDLLQTILQTLLKNSANWDRRSFVEIFFKCFATGVVMVYNFISRKLTLEKKD